MHRPSTHRLSTHRPIRRQRGVTVLGWLVLLIPVAVVVYAVIRLAPVYLNYMNVARSLEETASSFSGEGSTISAQSIRNTLSRHFEVDSIDFPAVNDVTIHRNGAAWVLEAKYQDVAPLFANVSLLIDFDKVSHIGGG
ncbi:MAG: DUF4845 domain-containing protein [Steroidobacteraceae bacterium]